MGWSCAAKAGLVLDQVSNFCVKNTGASNVFAKDGETFFFERGREHNDGRITGTIWRNVGNNLARKVGTFLIDADGKIVRFPMISKESRKKFEVDAAKEYSRIYEPKRANNGPFTFVVG